MFLYISLDLLFGIRYRPAVSLNMVHGTEGYQIRQYFYLSWKIKNNLLLYLLIRSVHVHVWCIGGLINGRYPVNDLFSLDNDVICLPIKLAQRSYVTAISIFL